MEAAAAAATKPPSPSSPEAPAACKDLPGCGFYPADWDELPGCGYYPKPSPAVEAGPAAAAVFASPRPVGSADAAVAPDAPAAAVVGAASEALAGAETFSPSPSDDESSLKDAAADDYAAAAAGVAAVEDGSEEESSGDAEEDGSYGKEGVSTTEGVFAISTWCSEPNVLEVLLSASCLFCSFLLEMEPSNSGFARLPGLAFLSFCQVW